MEIKITNIYYATILILLMIGSLFCAYLLGGYVKKKEQINNEITMYKIENTRSVDATIDSVLDMLNDVNTRLRIVEKRNQKGASILHKQPN